MQMDADAALAMSDASGDQGFLPEEMSKRPRTHLTNAIEVAFFYHGDINKVLIDKDSSTNAAFLSLSKGLKAARESALKQHDMTPGKVASMTTDQLSFLTERRKQFEESDGKDQRLRQMYFSIQPEFSEAGLENLAESTSPLRISE